MRETTLVIMAAGIGSRFGNGIKQLQPVGPYGEIIMDYSIYDAIKAGFNNIVFIIRKDIEQQFKSVIGHRIEKIAPVKYVYQELQELPGGYRKPELRTRPWGTGQAVLCCKELVNTPFAVINADDYYGQEAFQKIYKFLAKDDKQKHHDFCMAGYVLGNTLSEFGTVTRGICGVDDNRKLMEVRETYHIYKNDNGEIMGDDKRGNLLPLSEGQIVSMNIWGLTPDIFKKLEEGFKQFLNDLEDGDNTKEYLLPIILDQLIKAGEADITVLETQDRWFGITYQEDINRVISSIKQMTDQGKYPPKLYGSVE